MDSVRGRNGVLFVHLEVCDLLLGENARDSQLKETLLPDSRNDVGLLLQPVPSDLHGTLPTTASAALAPLTAQVGTAKVYDAAPPRWLNALSLQLLFLC